MCHDPKSSKIMFLANSDAGGIFKKFYVKFSRFSTISKNSCFFQFYLVLIERSRCGKLKNGLRIDLKYFDAGDILFFLYFSKIWSIVIWYIQFFNFERTYLPPRFEINSILIAQNHRLIEICRLALFSAKINELGGSYFPKTDFSRFWIRTGKFWISCRKKLFFFVIYLKTRFLNALDHSTTKTALKSGLKYF